jgi:hypothetical protein
VDGFVADAVGGVGLLAGVLGFETWTGALTWVTTGVTTGVGVGVGLTTVAAGFGVVTGAVCLIVGVFAAGVGRLATAGAVGLVAPLAAVVPVWAVGPVGPVGG